MENVSGARTSEQQTFVLVLFLTHLSLQTWGEVLRGLPLSLSLFFLALVFSDKNLQFDQYYHYYEFNA